MIHLVGVRSPLARRDVRTLDDADRLGRRVASGVFHDAIRYFVHAVYAALFRRVFALQKRLDIRHE